MTAERSISLKVVNMAMLCCASTRRRATVRRSGVMRTTSSSRPGASGVRGTAGLRISVINSGGGAGGGGAGAGTAAETGAGGAFSALRAERVSSLGFGAGSR